MVGELLLFLIVVIVFPGPAVSTLGVAGVVVTLSANMSANCLSAVRRASVTWKGLAGVGFCKACIKSLAARCAASAEDNRGMLTCVGKNSTVSHIRSLLVFVTWMR
jgi:hypothetical protein